MAAGELRLSSSGFDSAFASTPSWSWPQMQVTAGLQPLPLDNLFLNSCHAHGNAGVDLILRAENI